MSLFVVTFASSMENIKLHITQTALGLFKQLGLRNVSIDAVCAELRISKKTFYQYFGKKEDLIEETVLYEQQIHMERFLKCVKDKNAIEIFIHMLKEMKRALESEPFIMWHDLNKYYPALYQKFDKIKTEAIMSGFEANIRQGIAEGLYRDNLDIELLSFFHSVQIKNTFEMMAHSQKKYTLKRLIDFFIDMVFHLIANERGLKYLEENYYEKKGI